eukprot:NODE_20167_length_810_cov_1.692533.p1 GENE.NODE_20167_length_810_cov_1.692533~~NODE_20167_length_810_cov_1.692533.p1  ORF type:complete len:127 (-),score=36.09 NODE_20167_length_810_cov_1.692533:343-723(-)
MCIRTRLQHHFLSGHMTEKRTEVVMMSQVLADEVNAGHESGWIGSPTVRTVCGTTVRDLDHMAKLVDAKRRSAGKGDFIRLGIDTSSGPLQVVLPVDGLDEADERVAMTYAVPALRSADIAAAAAS